MALETNLLAYWKLNESSRDATDSVGGLVLTNNNTVAYSTGKLNNGIDLGSSNTNKYMNIANTLGVDGGAFTMNFWVNITTAPGSGIVYGLVGQYNSSSKVSQRLYYHNSSGTLKVYFNLLIAGIANHGIDYTYTLTTGTWYMLSYTYNGTTVTGYINGSSIGTDTGSGSGSDSGYYNGILVGVVTNNTPPVNPASAKIDEVSFWSRGLSTTEIAQLYNQGNGMTYANGVLTAIVGNNFLQF